MDIQELVASVTLEDVWCIERVGRLELDQQKGLVGWAPVGPTGDLNLGVNPIAWGRRIETWFRMSVDHPQAQLFATFAVVYRREDDSVIPDTVQREFLERVAAMACVPYLRVALQQLAAELRLGNIVIPMVRQGEIDIDLAENGS